MTKVLLLTNDSSLKKLIDLTLTYSGFIVHTVVRSHEAWQLLDQVKFDLVMIDYRLSDNTGLEFYKSLRQLGSNVPVLMIGEGDFDAFMLKDLSIDNYDFLLKPFKFRELKDKINSLLKMNTQSDEVVCFGELKIDLRQHLVSVKDKIIQLGKMEMRILILLAKKAGNIVDPKTIKKLIEDEGNIPTMTSFYYVNKLSQKMKSFSGEALEIVLIRNQGYILKFRN
jgi:two-component system KDP operon response regulator KdpE